MHRGINNSLYQSAIVDGKCSATSLTVHGTVDDLVIENNLIKEDVGAVTDYCWGISVDPGYTTVEEEFHNIVIRKENIVGIS